MAVVTAQEMYAAMCQFAHDHGYRREEPGSGWWYHEEDGNPGFTIGELVEHELQRQGVDMRQAPPVIVQVDAPGTLGADGG
jgi:hypothetical protein